MFPAIREKLCGGFRSLGVLRLSIPGAVSLFGELSAALAHVSTAKDNRSDKYVHHLVKCVVIDGDEPPLLLLGHPSSASHSSRDQTGVRI